MGSLDSCFNWESDVKLAITGTPILEQVRRITVSRDAYGVYFRRCACIDAVGFEDSYSIGAVQTLYQLGTSFNEEWRILGRTFKEPQCRKIWLISRENCGHLGLLARYINSHRNISITRPL